ncbi:amidohydrolase [Pectinatus brassicae]|uniref:Peptidase M20 domain-containing protein 2 n=1 Tax=Pectinatus brassicae TaxID=862415 RepID=A0A840UJH3_9FIRM|nr:amidohydrolase [Pectinatus brassicae]MBB5337149.1 amidohydrolase [Pectinatus brassicae]
MTKDELKELICSAIDKRQSDIIDIADSIYKEPELGYKEHKTSEKVKKLFDALNIEYSTDWGITGVKGRLKGKSSKKTVALLAELDALVCRNHPDADEATGAMHCCGHNIQIANMAAIAMAFKDTNAMQYLDGDIVPFAVPAEECIEIDYRNTLRNKGKIKYLGGKEEIIAQGGFDDIDISLQMHVHPTEKPNGEIQVAGSCNGFIAKIIEYKGKAAHAAFSPDQGINALNAAMLGIMGVNALRETFKESDCIRFHPIINNGGDLVNVVPDYVQMESYVRASNVKALKETNIRVNRALKAGADAIGAECIIHDLPGYLPLFNDKTLSELLRSNSRHFFATNDIFDGVHSAGSTDMGDVAHIMPVLHTWVGCTEGALHSAQYKLTDAATAYGKTPKAIAMTIIDLLYDNAAEAEKIVKNYKPVMTKETYLEYMESIK